jgi:hypothetical protein
MKIVLEGTSSSGKSSIVSKFPKKYKKISVDDIYFEFEFLKDVKNKYYTKKEVDETINSYYEKTLASRVKNDDNYIIDMVNDRKGKPIINKYLSKDVINILLYTNLADLVYNINKRKNSNPRGKFVFNQFAKYYMVTDNINKSIDTINLKSFIKNLKKMKYGFESEKALKKFAKDIFKSLGISKISDTKDYHIKPRYSKFDMILPTKNKSPTQLKNIIINFKCD